jgi:hypothetical protein
VEKIFANCMILLLAALVSGCSSSVERDTPVGQACYRSFAYESSPRYYKCLFELSAPSDFYDDKEIDRVLDAFVAHEGGTCERGPERDVADVRTQTMEHGLRYRLFDIVCR